MTNAIVSQAEKDYLNQVFKIVKNYITDVLYDLYTIRKGTQCLFFINENGTHSIPFTNPEEYPKNDKPVKYLFGEADRYHILKNSTINIIDAYIKKCNTEGIYFFDGELIREITEVEAKWLTNDYYQNTLASFKSRQEPTPRQELTYDIHFNDDYSSNSKGFEISIKECEEYLETYNIHGTHESYFKDYKGGVVSIVCNETDDIIHEELVRY